MIFFKLGFRNLWRNKRRTFLTGMAVGLGLSCLILMDGFWLGMMDNMIKSVTSTYIGEAQIHHERYQDTFESSDIIKDSNDLLGKIRSSQIVESFSDRVIASGMISSSNDSLNVRVLGVDPNREKDISRFDDRMVHGEFLNSSSGLVIGERLRAKLGVDIGDRIVLTVSEVASGEISQEMFRLTGVFAMDSKELDQGIALIAKDKLQSLIKLKGIHEISLNFKAKTDQISINAFLGTLRGEGLSVKTWQELAPGITATLEMSDMSIGIMGIIMFSLVALGILNTMFMSLFERSYEFGVIQAVGTRKLDILKMILSESASLGLISIGFAFIISGFFATLMSVYGIDYSGIEYAGTTFTDKIYYIFHIKQITLFPVVTLLFTMLVSLYPAWKTIRMKPAKALHRSL